MSSGLAKYSGTGFLPTSLNIEHLDGEITYYDISVLQTPLRQKQNDIVDCLDGMLGGSKGFDTLRMEGRIRFYDHTGDWKGSVSYNTNTGFPEFSDIGLFNAVSNTALYITEASTAYFTNATLGNMLEMAANGNITIPNGDLYLTKTNPSINSNSHLSLIAGSGYNVKATSPYVEIGDGATGTLKAMGGSGGSAGVFMYNGTSLSALLRHTPSAASMQLLNYVNAYYNGLTLYDSGASILSSKNGANLTLDAGTGKVVIDNTNIYDNVIVTNATGNSSFWQQKSGTIYTSLVYNDTYSYSALFNAAAANNGLFLYNTGKVVLQSTGINNLEIMSNYAGAAVLIGSYTSGKSSALSFIPLSDSVMAFCAVDRTNVDTKRNLRMGHWTANNGIFYDVSTDYTGFHNDSPAERLDVNGYVRASSGYKIGATEVINSSAQLVVPTVIPSYTDFSDAPNFTFGRDATSGDLYFIYNNAASGWIKIADI